MALPSAHKVLSEASEGTKVEIGRKRRHDIAVIRLDELSKPRDCTWHRSLRDECEQAEHRRTTLGGKTGRQAGRESDKTAHRE